MKTYSIVIVHIWCNQAEIQNCRSQDKVVVVVVVESTKAMLDYKASSAPSTNSTPAASSIDEGSLTELDIRRSIFFCASEFIARLATS